MNEMFAPLSGDELAIARKAIPKTRTKAAIVPVPDDAPPMAFRHPKHGAPAHVWPYHEAQGHLVGYVCRWDFTDAAGNPAKEILPVTFCDLGNGKRDWRSKGIPAPRPLFGLPEILARPEAPVLVTEGEKTRDAAAALFPDFVVTTPAHGAKSPHLTDFAVLAGRAVIIATDHDAAGQSYGDRVFELARTAGAASIQHLPPDRLGAWIWREGEKVLRDGPVPDGWDLADALAEGWTADAVAALRDDPAFLPPYQDAATRETARRREAGEPEELVRWPFRVVDTGVERRVEQKEDGVTILSWRWFCSVLEVVADTRSTDGEDWGRLLRIVDRDGRAKEWAMPMSMLAGDGTAYRERLLSLGLVMAPGKFAREALHEYISTARPGEKARAVTALGWSGGNFVLPRQTFGDQTGERGSCSSPMAGLRIRSARLVRWPTGRTALPARRSAIAGWCLRSRRPSRGRSCI